MYIPTKYEDFLKDTFDIPSHPIHPSANQNSNFMPPTHPENELTPTKTQIVCPPPPTKNLIF